MRESLQTNSKPAARQGGVLRLTRKAQALVQGLVALASLSTSLAGADGPMVHYTPNGFRGGAVFAPLPDFPQETLRAGREGRVVVQVVANYPPGAVQSLTFLETVDEYTRDSVSAALKRWRFGPLKTRGGTVVKGVPFTGRLIFYFRIRDGKPEVIDAAATKGDDQERRPGAKQ